MFHPFLWKTIYGVAQHREAKVPPFSSSALFGDIVKTIQHQRVKQQKVPVLSCLLYLESVLDDYGAIVCLNKLELTLVISSFSLNSQYQWYKSIIELCQMSMGRRAHFAYTSKCLAYSVKSGHALAHFQSRTFFLERLFKLN